MLETISDFYNQILSDPDGHRYRSWEHCFGAFEDFDKSTDSLSLHLGFYLASWGMYRGSSGLLWKDYKIHSTAVELIQLFPEIRASKTNQRPDPEAIHACIADLREYYSSIAYCNNKTTKSISPTDTLISKIILGATGSLPAFDRYFLVGTQRILKSKSLNLKNIAALYSFANDNANEIESCQSYIIEKSGYWYPQMKILDMYFW